MIALLTIGIACLAFWAGIVIGEKTKIAKYKINQYEKGYDDAKEFYKGMAKQRITGDISIKKQQLN